MEIICRIVEQQQLQEIETKQENGGSKKLAKMGFVLAAGAATFYCEMWGEQARQQPTLSKDYYYLAEVTAKAVSRSDANGATWWNNNLRLNNISML